MRIGLPIDGNNTWKSPAQFLANQQSIALPVTLFPDPNHSLSDHRTVDSVISEKDFWNHTLNLAEIVLKNSVPNPDVLNFQPGNEDVIQRYGTRFDIIALGHAQTLDPISHRIDRGRIGRVLTHTTASLLLCHKSSDKASVHSLFVIINPKSDISSIADNVVKFACGPMTPVSVLLANNYDACLRPLATALFRQAMTKVLERFQQAIASKINANTFDLSATFIETPTPENIDETVEKSLAPLIIFDMGNDNLVDQFDLNPVVTKLINRSQNNLLLIRAR